MTAPLAPQDVLLERPFRFTRRESALPADLRPVRRVSLLMFIIDHCWAGRATLEQLHVMDWACRSPETRALFLQCLANGRGPEFPCVRFDPSLNRAIDWGVGFGLLSTTTSSQIRPDVSPNKLAEYRVWLTPRGEVTLKDLAAIPDCLTAERSMLEMMANKITQGFVRPYLRWELGR
jgi:hypothetical protein